MRTTIKMMMTRRPLFLMSGLVLAAVLPLSLASSPPIFPIPPPPPGETSPPVFEGPATYWVTFSTRIRPGMRLPVTVHLVTAGHTASVVVSLVDHQNRSQVFAQAPATPVSTGDNVIYLEIPTTLKRPDWRSGYYLSYAVQVVSTGAVAFNQSQVVDLYEKAFSIFVQTDKAIYKPGQTVKIRALAMDPQLTVLKEPVDIFIRDSLGNGIKRWSQLLSDRASGVVEVRMPTSTDPPLGDWEIDVTVRKYTETKKFTIDKYVLPKFEATLDVPEVVLTSGPGIRGKALAKYTFGKPLTGAEVTVTLKHSWYRGDNSTDLTRTGTLNKDGEMPFYFPMAQLEGVVRKAFNYRRGNKVYMAGSRFKIISKVTDVRTRRSIESEESQVRLTEDPADVDFLPLTPNTYKPGLRYTAYIKVTQPDGTLFPNPEKIDVLFNVTSWVPQDPLPTKPPPPPPTPLNESARAMKRMMILPPRMPPFYSPEKEVPLLTVSKKLTINGFLFVEVNVPSEAKRISVKVEAMGVRRQRSIEKASSRSGNFVQITGQQNSPKVGELAKLRVRTTEPVTKLIYQVYTKSLMVIESEASATDVENQKFLVTFPVTANMAPNCKVLVFYIRQDGREVVADSLSFKVDPSTADQVSVSYSRDKVRPGDEVRMTVKARPSSLVFLLAVDKSVQLLKSGNDITQQMVSEELAGYDFGGGFMGHWRYMFICGWPYPSNGVDAFSIFRDANVAMLTDADLYRKPPVYWNRFRGGPMMMSAAVADGAQGGFGKAAPPPAPSSAPESLAERVRTFFPETWLWDVVEIGPMGQVVSDTIVPDTITTWLTSAFAVHPQHGLSVIQEPTPLTTFKDAFVSLDLPYSAIRGEDLCLKALGFNYHNHSTEMTMVMDLTEGIQNIRVVQGRQYRRSEVVTHPMGRVDSNEVKETLFCFTPMTLGSLPLRVNLSTTVPSADAVQRPLLVEAEGTPRVTNVPVMLDVQSGQLFQRSVPIRFPSDTVPDSQRITVSVAGDLLGPVFENLDDLLRMPYGCGEQNMLYFAPNVFLIDYLQTTNTYTPERAEKAENYMLVGYQKEIRYQHNDGSFSAFGNNNKNESGSMWLTAFVVKCFAQSLALQGDVVSVEPKIVQRALMWMVSRQNLKDGSFPEPGRVFNKNMQGGSAKGEALTAYVLIALAESHTHFSSHMTANDSQKLQTSISLARSYLEQQLTSLTDSYDLAIVTYALHITNSSMADQAFNLLMSKAVRGSLTLYWERPKPAVKPRYFWQRQTDAINIEMTSYALLTFVARDDVAGGLAIVRWLTGQRGPQGGFISTQDTVVGLQALAQVAGRIYQASAAPISVTVMWTLAGQQRSKTIVLDDSTRALLQKVYVPVENNEIPSEVVIQASSAGQGTSSNNFAVAEVALNYNALADTTFYPFMLYHAVQRQDSDRFILRMLASRIDNQSSMTVIDVALLTGYDVDVESPLYDVASAKTAEQKGRHYILYFDKIDRREVAITLPMVLTSGLNLSPKPGVILIYDYYENAGDQQLAVKYKLQGSTGICNAQPSYEDCKYSRFNRFNGFFNPFRRLF